ncbi:MAG: nitrous oxide reductase accessory protein NosL [Leptospiraceae bacterium]|nr:nitrous oxide reductase accessory protein NosL [Leptospiraceae bacterium]MCB1170659.1 nitrous oxide reductase accessory protein NosL [Leptospiraceae bacterium]
MVRTAGERKAGVLWLCAALVSALLVAGCGSQGPEEFGENRYHCEHCRMGIVDMRFAAQSLTVRGKRHHFDSVECLESWRKKSSEEIQESYVSDFDRPGTWLKSSRAHYVVSQKRPSPMGANISAYSSRSQARKALDTLQEGRILSFAELSVYLDKGLRAKPSEGGHGFH